MTIGVDETLDSRRDSVSRTKTKGWAVSIPWRAGYLVGFETRKEAELVSRVLNDVIEAYKEAGMC